METLPYRRSPLPVPTRSGSCQSSGITSPERLAGAAITSLPLLSETCRAARVSARQSTGQYHRVIGSAAQTFRYPSGRVLPRFGVDGANREGVRTMDESRKSTYSGANGGDCVEVASADLIMVRDTTELGGPVLTFTSHMANLHRDHWPWPQKSRACTRRVVRPLPRAFG